MAPTIAAPADPTPEEDPIKAVFADMVEKLNHLAGQPGTTLTFDGLLAVFGPLSHALALFIFSLLNMLPGPPGYNFLMALIITIIATKMLLRQDIRVWRFIGRTKMPLKLIIRLVNLVSMLASRIARVSAPRLLPLTGPAAQPAIALFAIVLGVAQLAPIPGMNLVPAIGLAMVSVGQLNRDGIMVIIGFVVGLIGLAVLAFSIWLITIFVVFVEDVVDGN